MQLELRHLRYFLAVAEELNFSRAAGRLHITQPALPAQIRALEKQLGCELFVRTTRKVELTVPGVMLLEDAREIVSLSDQAAARLVAVGRGRRGLLRIGFVAHGAGVSIVPERERVRLSEAGRDRRLRAAGADFARACQRRTRARESHPRRR